MVSCNRVEETYVPLHAPFLQLEGSKADSLLQEMTMEEKIGQLFIWAPAQGLATSRDSLFDFVANGQIGGLLLQQIPLDSFLSITDSCHNLAERSLLIGSEEKVVLNNQFSDTYPYPKAATLSTLFRDSLVKSLEDLYVEQCQALGINFCFAPSLHQNTKADSIFNYSCMAHEQEALLWQSTRVMHKLQNQQILSFADNFKDLLYIPQDTTKRLDSILQPLINLSLNGLSGILSHDKIFAEDTTMFKPMDYLKNYGKKNLDFAGLHLARVAQVADIEKQFLAGVDLFLIQDSLENYTQQLINLVENGFLSERMLNNKVHQILRAKHWINKGANAEFGQREKVVAQLKDKNQEFAIRQLYQSSLTLAQNPKDLLPLQNIAQQRFSIVQIGNKKLSPFLNRFDFYADQTNILYPLLAADSIAPLNVNRLKKRTVVLTLEEVPIQAEKHSSFIESVNALAAHTDVVLVNFGNPFNLSYFDSTMAMLQVFEHNLWTEEYAAEAIFGGRPLSGQLPLAISDRLPYGHGWTTISNRLGYALPEEVGIAAYKLVGIDAIARSAIAKGATPGCQVMVLKDGKIVYEKNFGYQSKKKLRRLQSKHLYDIASITKVAGTTMAAMKMYEGKQIRISDRLDKYLDVGSKSPIKRLTLKQLMTHTSGLRSYMPINAYVMARDSNSRDCSEYFCYEKRDPYTIKVADSTFMDYHYVDTIWQDVYQIKPRRRKRFLYSDLNFALVHKIIETKSKMSLDDYLNRKFYKPLNLRRTAFRPLEQFAASDINPTAHDTKWRKQVLHGHVHDESAALLNGVAGNAGLFSNARDMAVLFQMLLNKGSYGGKEYLSSKTIEFFTKPHTSRTHRGLGFDKRSKSKSQACSPKASAQTFGHTGFTGTCVWVDPKEDLVFIFLANRINESTKNKKLFRDKVRRRMHTVVYKALDTYDPTKGPELKESPTIKEGPTIREAKAEM